MEYAIFLQTPPLKTIVYIDDDLEDIALFQEAINAIAPLYGVESFCDSKTGVEFLEANIVKPDIIFLDINMPLLNGKQALLLIRRIKNMSDVPVIIYSTTIHGEDRQVLLEMGANDLLQKNNSFEGVVSDLNKLLKRFVHVDSKSIL